MSHLEQLLQELQRAADNSVSDPAIDMPRAVQVHPSSVIEPHIIRATQGMVDLAPKPTDDFVDITPTPAYVIKTATTDSTKVFINVCASPAVPAPSNWQANQARLQPPWCITPSLQQHT